MIDDPDQNEKRIREVVEQLTRRKLAYSRELLGLRSGSRTEIRDRLIFAVQQDVLDLKELIALLHDLDAWGNQRIRLLRFTTLPPSFNSLEMLRDALISSAFADLVDADPDISPPPTMTPLSITFPDQRTVRLVAGSLDSPLERIQGMDNRQFDDAPDVIWVPHREEHQKSTSFAQIDIKSGLCILSTTRSGSRTNYSKEFGQFARLFRDVIDFGTATRLQLFRAIQRLYTESNATETMVSTHEAKTKMGGTIIDKSPGRGIDLRSDIGHVIDYERNTSAVCNCRWVCRGDLKEEVHALIFAPDGELAVYGQVKEESVRHVIRRILELNSN